MKRPSKAQRLAAENLEDEGALRAAEIETKSASQPQGVEPAAAAYDLFRDRQGEGEFPAWRDLAPQTQALWREGYSHIIGGGAPRTDYEQAVKYLIDSVE